MTRNREICLTMLVPGAVLIVVSGCRMGGLPKVWVDRTEHLELSASDLDAFHAQTHNGRIRITAAEEGSATIVVDVTIKAGGRNQEDAEACLNAFEIVTPVSDRTQIVKANWKMPKQSDWQGKASYVIVMPPNLKLQADTHNGSIEVKDHQGECKLTTHNGGVKAINDAGPLVIETHNGSIEATTSSDRVQFDTHNGQIQATLTNPERIQGRIDTHNGSITVDLAETVATQILADTHNGKVHCGLTLENVKADRRSVQGTLNGGDEKLVLDTYNGSITVK